jgi:hypothetical protein
VTLGDLKDIATILGVIVAAATLAKAVFEYVAQGRQKRAEAYFALERSFWEDAEFPKICELLETDSPDLATIPLSTKLSFVGFHEEVALMLNSKLLREEVAHYMFGYYAIRCYNSNHFWRGEDKSDVYWSLFRSFAERMKHFETTFRFDNKKLRF